MKTCSFIFVTLVLFLVSSCNTQPKSYSTTFDDGLKNWEFSNRDGWKLIKEGDKNILYLSKPGQMGLLRAPKSRAILSPFNFRNFELSVKARCLTDTTNTRRDICLFFGYQDSTHYYYAHFSGISDRVHNIIAIVNDSDRTKINVEKPGESGAYLNTMNWYDLTVTRNADTGEIRAYVNNISTPVMTAIDTTFKTGKVGIGSFDDTAYFASLRVEEK